MKKSPIYILLIFLVSGIKAQYITEILDYTPAPGQYINTIWGSPHAASSIQGGINGMVSLGAFGGSIVFRFEEAVENHPDNPFGIDFTIFGNPQAEWSEHGIVLVMKDENNNGKPDDTWYELAGSDYFLSSSVRNYMVTYVNPGGNTVRDVPWSDNLGSSGFIYGIDLYQQMYYPHADSFPAIEMDQYSLSGSLVLGSVDRGDPLRIRSISKPFGYADNRPRGIPPYTLPDNPYTEEIENSGGDAFDIDWAVDGDGTYVDLDMIHFVKVQTAINDHGGWLGEISTEITGAVDVTPDPSKRGAADLIIVKTLPDTISGDHFQIEAFAYHRGRISNNEKLNWSADLAGVNVEDNLISFTTSGFVTLTGSIESNPQVSKSIQTFLDYREVSGDEALQSRPVINLYPNPANENIQLDAIGTWDIQLFNALGKEVFFMSDIDQGNTISVAHLDQGVYFASLQSGPHRLTVRLIIQ